MRIGSRVTRFLAGLIMCWGGTTTAAEPGKVMLVLGDSLSAAYGIETRAGWVNLLAQRLSPICPDCTVVNASISGETTDGGLRRLPALLREHQPRWVLIELGANDGLRGFPPDIIRQNLSSLVSLSKNAGATVVLIGMHIPSNYGPAYTSAFHQSYHEVAKAHGAALLPFLLDEVYNRDGMLQEDGLHPTAAAQPLMLENVWRVLLPLL